MKGWMFLLLFIAGLLLGLFLASKCSGNRTDYPVLYRDTVIYKPVVVRDSFAVPGKTIIDSIPYEIPLDVDTEGVVKDYFSKYVVNRTWEDSVVTFTLSDTIDQNKLSSGKAFWEVRYKEKTVVEIEKQPIRNVRFFVGGSVGVNTTLQSLSPEILLHYKEKNIYGIGYDIPGRAVVVKGYIPVR